MRRILSLFPLAVIYFIAYSYGYLEYINPAFEYAGYNYIPKDIISYLYLSILSIIPIFFFRTSASPSGFAAVLIYSIIYVPGLSTFYFNWNHSHSVFFILGLLCICMIIIFIFSGALWKEYGIQLDISNSQKNVVHALYIASLICTLIYYHSHMRLVGFSDVYELRFETNKLINNQFVSYLLSWQTYALIPFYYAYAIYYKRIDYFIVGSIGSILAYISSGSKAAILLPVLILGINYAVRNRRYFFHRLLFGLSVLIFTVTTFFADEGVWLWIKSILLVRILATNGWVLSKYYDYFSNNGYTFYSHIGFLDNIFYSYPYGDYSLGQLIGIEYSGSALANFNANFLASDGIAAMGEVGLFIATLFICIFFICANYCTRGYPSRFVILWLSGFWIALLNLPLTTALFSGGAILILLISLSKKLRFH